MGCRKVTFKLYPNAREAERLTAWVRLHCEMYNAALQERIEAYRKAGKSISYYDQQNVLPEIKAARPDFVELGSHALQQTLRRLDLAFQAFFRRIKAGQTPGFPRFKASKRFSGFCYPDPAGWKLHQQGQRGGTLRLGSSKDAMAIRVRGQHRFGAEAKPNDLTIIRKNSEWFASVTLRVPETACARERRRSPASRRRLRPHRLGDVRQWRNDCEPALDAKRIAAPGRSATAAGEEEKRLSALQASESASGQTL